MFPNLVPHFTSRVTYIMYQVEDISRESQVERELMLIKLNAEPNSRAEVMISIIQPLV